MSVSSLDDSVGVAPQSAPVAPGAMAFFRRTLRAVWIYWPMLGVIAAALSIQVLFRLLLPLGYQRLIDDAILDGQPVLGLLLGLLFGGWLLQLGASFLQDYTAARMWARVMNDLRLLLFRQIQRLSTSFYARVDANQLTTRFADDLLYVENVYTQVIFTVVLNALLVLGGAVLLIYLEWQLALLALMVLPIALLMPRVLGISARYHNRAHETREAQVAAIMRENIDGNVVVRTLGLQAHHQQLFQNQLEDLGKKAVRSYFATFRMERSASQTLLLIQLIVIGIGAYFATFGLLSLGALVAFSALYLQLINSVSYLLASRVLLHRGARGLQRLDEFLAEEPHASQPALVHIVPPLSRVLSLERICFGYSGHRTALENLSLKVLAGESLAIVGPKGSGKSSVLNLVLRLYGPYGGRIMVDDVELSRDTEESFRAQTGVVTQETFLFNTSFHNNIRMGKLEASQEEIISAAQEAGIHDAIMALPLQYDTQVGERGGNLSSEQRQRVALARALVRDPRLLVLDEVTSSLDQPSENSLIKTLVRVARGRTVLAASHRLASVSYMDRILVMDQGRFVEEGTHQELLERRGLYYRMWQKQSGFVFDEDGQFAHCTPQRLRAIPLLANLDDDHLDTVAAMLVSEYYPESRRVVVQGDPGDKFFIIVHGTVEVVINRDGKEERVSLLDEGDYFGELALLDGAPRNATVRTTVPTILLSFGRQQFKKLLADEPELRTVIEAKARFRRTMG